MNMYLPVMAAGSVLLFALYGLRCARAVRLPQLRARAWETALLAFLFSAVFGTVLARIGYALLMQELDFEYEGIAALERLPEFEIDRVSFLGGALGVCLGVLLANRLTRKGSVLAGMDAFAPFGALLAALFRMGECFFPACIGSTLPEDSPLAFFPFALKTEIDGGYISWDWAVCVLSAAFALIWAAIAFFRLRSRGRTGLGFTLTLFFLALPQIFCESLRKDGMYWLFVHVEQLLCAVVLVGVILFWVLSSGKDLSFLRRWGPVLVFLLCVGLLVLTEFVIDGKILDASHTVCYIFMWAVLAAVGAAGTVAAGRWNSAKQ